MECFSIECRKTQDQSRVSSHIGEKKFLYMQGPMWNKNKKQSNFQKRGKRRRLSRD